jgi:hypothetical protein
LSFRLLTVMPFAGFLRLVFGGSPGIIFILTE